MWHLRVAVGKSYFSRKHDTLLYYVKTPEAPFFVDAIRVPYKETSGYAKGGIVSKTGKHYMPHPDGTPVDDVWDIPIINPLAGERTGFPTQKPLALYERIIKIAEGDVILDPFCGWATSSPEPRQWVGWTYDGAVEIKRIENGSCLPTSPLCCGRTGASAPFIQVRERSRSRRPPHEPDGDV